jgi:O-antigen biosynthesis protein
MQVWEKLLCWPSQLVYKNIKAIRLKQQSISCFISYLARKILIRTKLLSPKAHLDRAQKRFNQWNIKRRKNSVPPLNNLKELGFHPVNFKAAFEPIKKSNEKLITIITLNRNGAKHLQNLFESFLKFNTYPKFEFIIVDHASTDESCEIIKNYQHQLNLTLIVKDANDTFSKSNNKAAIHASGEYLFFLNNDIIFISDILAQLLEYMKELYVGATCPLLLYPSDIEFKDIQRQNTIDLQKKSLIQHAGIRFYYDETYDLIRPYNLHSLQGIDKKNVFFPAVTGAAMFCRKNDFMSAGGFNEQYNYGMEDVDLCLTFITQLNKASFLAKDTPLVHAESATQNKQKEGLAKRRKKNWDILNLRFGPELMRAVRRDQITDDCFWSDRSFSVAFAVTEANSDTKAGDYFTAMELAEACEKEFAWTVKFLGKNRNWYNLRGIDLIIAMVDSYDLSLIYNVKPGLIKIAWMRNWFDRWTKRPSFCYYDLFLCSCEKGIQLVKEKGEPAHLFPIATNADRFCLYTQNERPIDICFTGHKRGVTRDIEDMLHPERLGYNFAVYGNGWEGHETFGPYWRGFIPYKSLPQIYRSSKIVIDDAVNGIAKPWGSINSSVFDALASGALVITNSIVGATDTFRGELPNYKTSEELHELIDRYLNDSKARLEKVNDLNHFVLANHTYKKRALELKSILTNYCDTYLRIAIKTPVPGEREAHKWGDYHFACSLKRALIQKGHAVRIDLLPDWNKPSSGEDDAVIVLRGLSRYEPRPESINIMWNISHTANISFDEYEAYDHVFIASALFADKLSSLINCPVSPLLQCTDAALFHEDHDISDTPVHDVLFVGNSRKQRRSIVYAAMEAGIPMAIYGADWENMEPKEYVISKHIPNDDLFRYYSTSKIVLNDHWPFMKENGFISNRIFDAGACGACVVSDAATGLKKLFGDAVSVYHSPLELKNIIDHLLSDENERRRKGQELKKIVMENHLFSDRAEKILDVIWQLMKQKFKSLPAKDQVPGYRQSP